MNKHLSGKWVILVILLSGCLPAELARLTTQSPIPQPEVTPVPLKSPLPSKTRTNLTHIPASTPTPARTSTITLTPSITPYLPPDQPEALIPVCKSNGEPIPSPKDFGIDGVVVYQDQDGKGLYSVGGKPLTYSTLPVPENQEYVPFGFSPDGDWFAYSPTTFALDTIIERPTMALLSARGEILEKQYDIRMLPETREKSSCDSPHFVYSENPGWLNNHIIPILVRGFLFNHCWIEALLNPFTAELQEESITELPGFYPDTVAGYSPDMSRSLYEVLNKKSLDDDIFSDIVLWDVNQKKEISRYPSSSFLWPGSIHWSPDSTKVVFPFESVPELMAYLESRDGKQIKKVRNITAADPKIGEIYLHNFIWSPDSRYLAIIAEMVEEMSAYDKSQKKYLYYYLYIYDTQANEYIFRCPIHDYKTYPINTSQNSSYWIYWSPDNKKVLVSDNFYRGNPILLFDLESGQVIELVKKGVAAGWSDKFPVKWQK